MQGKNKSNDKTERDNLFIVGIGASAGGLDALQELINNVPQNSGLVFVIIQHLSPNYKSLMAEILSKHTSMRVFEAEEGMAVNENCIYLIPNKKIMTINKGMLLLEEKTRNGMPNMAIDHFLESLAADKGDRAVAIILSGTGTDGTKGIEAIKSKGGVVIVQDPMTAEFDGMPNSAIASGVADLILPPEMIVDELVDYLQESSFLKPFKKFSEKEELIFEHILELIKDSTANDFSLYKKPTLFRRLSKRMAEKNIQSINDYYNFLKNKPDEILGLSNEFLINVTKFFRDTEAFDLIKSTVLPTILLSKTTDNFIKIWVVACSTGEEAYSIAILVQEYLELSRRTDLNVKIFATDIDQTVLNIASRAIYSENSLNEVPGDILSKYFIKENGAYTVSPTIRKMVVFAKHDITRDPPFSKVDFLSCRNMLIYMNTVLQKAVLQKFHFALNENGYLMLGPSENLGELSECFKYVDKKWKVFKCVVKFRAFDNHVYLNPLSKDSYATSLNVTKSKNPLSNIAEIFNDTLLEEYKYAGIFIDKDFEVKQAIGNFKSFMSFPEGKLNFNILKLLPPDLSVVVGMAIRRSFKDNERVVMKGVKFLDSGKQKEANLIVKPFVLQKDYLQPFLFIILEEITSAEADVKPEFSHGPGDTSGRVLELEGELREVKANLQAVIEEIESSNEELQASNEEIISANEELQSTNEELQSLNEELHTVNAEHQLKIKELIELNDDLNNYFKNSPVGQILIDKDLIIRKFTPAAKKQINLIESDIGRSITDISTNFSGINFLQLVKEVISTQRPIEKELVMNNETHYLMRINPYLRQSTVNDGAVVNFIDVSEIKQLNGIIEAIFNSSPNGILALKTIHGTNSTITDFEIITANRKLLELFHMEIPVGSYLSATPSLLLNIEDIKRAVTKNRQFHTEHYNTQSHEWFDIIAIPMMDGVVVTISDITQKKNAENLLTNSFEQLKSTSNELSQTNTRLEQSNYDLMQFASVASHDLKEPLRKIQVFGNLLKDKIFEDLPKSEKNYLDKMISSSQRMQSLIDDVLTFSKLSNNDSTLLHTDLNEMIKQIVEDIDIAIKEKNAIIEVDQLPIVLAKPGQMRQLFQNLISNSLKFNNGVPVISIKRVALNEAEHAASYEKGEYCCIEVSDNGIGFDEKYGDKIFGLFQRLHGNIYHGTGLGLAICKKIVENHGGVINVSSKAGVGTVFRILLPLVSARKAAVLPDIS